MVAIVDLQLWICYRFPGGLFLSKLGAVSSLQISFVARPHKLSDACKRSDAKSESAAAQTNHDTHDLSLAAVIWAPALPVALERLLICSFGYATDFLVAFSFRSLVQYHRCRFLLWRAHTNFQMLAKGVTQKVKVQQLRPIIYIYIYLYLHLYLYPHLYPHPYLYIENILFSL